MYKRKTATYKKLAHYGRTIRNKPLLFSPIVNSQVEIQMVNDGHRERNHVMPQTVHNELNREKITFDLGCSEFCLQAQCKNVATYKLKIQKKNVEKSQFSRILKENSNLSLSYCDVSHSMQCWVLYFYNVILILFS